MARRPSLLRPDVKQYLLTDEGEFIVDEVVKHPVCMIVPCLFVFPGVVLMFFSTFFQTWWPLVLLIGLGLSLNGLWKFHVRQMDRFVITNMRVYRVSGVFNRRVQTMPLTRILDISVTQPFLGIIFKYGHFIFESAAADQGIRRISYVSDPTRRDLIIQRVIQRAGIRAVALAKEDTDD